MIHLKIIFWLTEFIAVNIIQVIVFYGKALTDLFAICVKPNLMID